MVNSAQKIKSLIISKEPIKYKLVMHGIVLNKLWRWYTIVMGITIQVYTDMEREVRNQVEKVNNVAGV